MKRASQPTPAPRVPARSLQRERTCPQGEGGGAQSKPFKQSHKDGEYFTEGRHCRGRTRTARRRSLHTLADDHSIAIKTAGQKFICRTPEVQPETAVF